MTISGGNATIFGAVASGQEIRFAGTGDLAFYDLTAFDATIGGYSTGDEFDLGGFAFSVSETGLSRRTEPAARNCSPSPTAPMWRT